MLERGPGRRDIYRDRGRPVRSLVAGGREENGVGVRPGGIELAVGGIDRQRRKDVVQRGEQGRVIDEIGLPRFTTVGAA